MELSTTHIPFDIQFFPLSANFFQVMVLNARHGSELYLYKNIIESANDLIQSVDIEGNILFVNKKWLEKLGYSREEALGMKVWKIIHSHHLEKCQEMFGLLMKGMALDNVETIFVTKDGKEIYVEGNLNAQFKDGEFSGTTGVFRDITKLKEAQAKLVRTSRAAGLGNLATGVAHEITNPLQKITGLSEIILDSDKIEEIHEDIGEVIKAGERIKNIVRGLSKYSNDLRNDLPVGDKVNQIVEESLNIASYSFDINKYKIETELNELPGVTIGSGDLKQSLVNLIINAVEASPEGGLIEIKTWVDDGFIKISVSDEGRGITQEELSEIFDPFYTTKDAGEGTGLGLYLVSSVVERGGGSVKVVSEPGEGTEFTIGLPVS